MQCMETLIQAGADVNTRSQSGETALLVAAASSHFDCVEILMRAGADVNAQSHYHFALISAAHNGNVEWTENLIQAGSDVNRRDVGGGTAVKYAAACGHRKCVDILIKAGADVNIRDNSGGTPLHMVAHGCDYSCVEMLIKAGIGVNFMDQEGHTALTLAAWFGRDKYIKMLLEAGAELHTLPQWPAKTELLYAAKSGNPECIKILLQAGADMNGIDGEGYSVLHELLNFVNEHQRRITCLRLLLAAGANVNKWNRMGKTAATGFLAGGGLSWTQEWKNAILKLCFTAGEDIGSATEEVRKNLIGSESEMCLRHLCRKTIRNHLLELDPHQNLFVRVPRLGLPTALSDYLLFTMSLQDDDN